MVDQIIYNYIKQQQQAGYDLNTIRTHLINYGYEQALVDEAISEIYKPPKKPFPFIPTIAGVLLVLIVIGGFFILTRDKVPEQLLDVQTSTLIDEIEAGNSLTFTIDMMNLGAKKRYDLTLTHELLDQNQNTVKSQQESAAIETRTSKTSQITIPSDTEPGTYTLKTTVQYNGNQATASFSFKIKEKSTQPPITPKECPENCDDNDECTQDTCSASTNFECQYTQITPCCNNNICETGETIENCPNDCEEEEPIDIEMPTIVTLADVKEQAEQLARTSPNQANNYCQNLEKDSHKDACYSKVAETTEISTYCDKIISDTKRDQCYIAFALEGDYLVCDKITNKHTKQSCTLLKNLP